MNEEDDISYTKRLSGALKRHGFPLEIETHQKLLSHEWKSIGESMYTDSDTGKRRTIDFLAWKTQKIDSQIIFSVDILLVIECKKRLNSAWVFYGAFPDTAKEWDARSILDSASFAVISDNPDWTSRWADSAIEKVLMACHSIIASEHKIAISGHEIRVPEDGSRKKLKNPDRDYFHDACSTVSKAVEVRYNQLVEEWEDRPPDNIQFIYPVVVFDGPMYWLTPSNGDFTLEKIQYVQLDWETKENSRTIDVVHISWLDDYLTMIDKELAETVSNLAGMKGWYEIVSDGIKRVLGREVRNTSSENQTEIDLDTTDST